MSRIRVPFASQVGSLLRLRRHVVLVLLVAAMLVPAALTSPVATAQGYCASAEEADLLGRINELRRSRGLGSLTLSVPLGAAADIKSADMANTNYFAHVSPSGVGPRDVLNRVGYPSNASWGENLAAGNSSGSATYQQWLNSPSHFSAMVNPAFTAIGLARADNANSRYEHYWTAMFGNQVVQQASTCSGANPNPPPVATTPPTATPQPTDTVAAILALLIAILTQIIG